MVVGEDVVGLGLGVEPALGCGPRLEGGDAGIEQIAEKRCGLGFAGLRGALQDEDWIRALRTKRGEEPD